MTSIDYISVVGIDLSLANTGLASIRGNSMSVRSINTKPKDFKDRVGRYCFIVDSILEFVFECKPSIIVIEDYAFGASFSRRSNNLTVLAELKGILLYLLSKDFTDVKVVDVATTTMKKYISKKGSIKVPDDIKPSCKSSYKKEVLMSCVSTLIRKAGVDADITCHDEADAFGLAMIAYHLCSGKSFSYLDAEHYSIQEKIINALTS